MVEVIAEECFVLFYRRAAVVAPRLCSGMVPAGSRRNWLGSPVDSSSCGVGGLFLLPGGSGRTIGANVRPIVIFIAALMAATVAVAMRATSHPAATTTVREIAPVVEQQPPEKAVVGTLESVSAGAAQIVVNTSDGRQTFTVESGATVRQGSRTIKTAELQSHKGERVKVRYRESAGVKRAAWIVLAAPPPKKGKQVSERGSRL
jgi:hypothetical protein